MTLQQTTCAVELAFSCVDFLVYDVVIAYILVKNYKTLSLSNMVILLLPPFAYCILIGFQSYQNSHGKLCLSSDYEDTALISRIALSLLFSTMMLKSIAVHQTSRLRMHHKRSRLVRICCVCYIISLSALMLTTACLQLKRNLNAVYVVTNLFGFLLQLALAATLFVSAFQLK